MANKVRQHTSLSPVVLLRGLNSRRIRAYFVACAIGLSLPVLDSQAETTRGLIGATLLGEQAGVLCAEGCRYSGGRECIPR